MHSAVSERVRVHTHALALQSGLLLVCCGLAPTADGNVLSRSPEQLQLSNKTLPHRRPYSCLSTLLSFFLLFFCLSFLASQLTCKNKSNVPPPPLLLLLLGALLSQVPLCGIKCRRACVCGGEVNCSRSPVSLIEIRSFPSGRVYVTLAQMN